MSAFGKTRLYLNQHRITITYELPGFLRHRLPQNAKEDIFRLERAQTDRGRPYLGIWVKKPWAEPQQYILSSAYSRLTIYDLDRIAQELSIWLDLPIHRFPI